MLPIHFSVKSGCRLAKTMFILQLHSSSRRAVFTNHKKSDSSHLSVSDSSPAELDLQDFKGYSQLKHFKQARKKWSCVKHALNKLQRIKKTLQSHFFPSRLPDVHQALVKKGEHRSEISTTKHTSPLPHILLACLDILQPRAKQGGSAGLFPQWFPAGCTAEEAAHLNTGGRREVRSTGRHKEQTGTRNRWLRRNWGWD